MTASLVLAVALLSACGKKSEEKAAQADAVANAAGFRSLDRNGDDRIDATELPRQNSRLMGLDRNKDGVISQIEWSEGTMRRFDQMDLNHDGTVTSEEESEWRAARDAGRAPPAQPTTPVLGDTLSNQGTRAQ
jgi:hypothetical protein